MVWADLGTVVPTINNWQNYNGTILPVDAIPTYRFSPLNLGVGEYFKTYALVRFQFYDAASDSMNVTETFRIYPHPEPLVRELAIPRPLIEQGVIIWIPETIKKVYRNFRGRSSEPSWGLKIEELRSETISTRTLDGGEY